MTLLFAMMLDMGATSQHLLVPVSRRGRPGTREALLDAVDALLEERGWAACSMQAVARRAGLTTGAIYSTFGSRGALLAASLTRRTGDVEGLDVREPDLRKAVTLYAKGYHHLSSGAAGRSLVATQLDLFRLAVTDEALRLELRETFNEMLAGLARDIDARRKASKPSAAALAQRMIAALQGLTLQQVAIGNDHISADTYVDVALAALGI